jgi:hypothetical protein
MIDINNTLCRIILCEYFNSCQLMKKSNTRFDRFIILPGKSGDLNSVIAVHSFPCRYSDTSSCPCRGCSHAGRSSGQQDSIPFSQR